MSGIGLLGLVDPSTLHDRVYAQFRDALMSGVFRPGEAVTLRGVAEAMGTSLMPVREAVRRLVASRALEMPNSRCTRVPLLTAGDVNDLAALRLLLEPAAAELAAQRMTADAHSELQELNKRAEAAYDANDFPAFLLNNRNFHARLYAAAGNDRLTETIDLLWMQSGPLLTLLQSVWRSGSFAEFKQTHRRLLQAVGRHKPPAARTAVERLISESSAMFTTLV